LSRGESVGADAIRRAGEENETLQRENVLLQQHHSLLGLPPWHRNGLLRRSSSALKATQTFLLLTSDAANWTDNEILLLVSIILLLLLSGAPFTLGGGTSASSGPTNVFCGSLQQKNKRYFLYRGKDIAGFYVFLRIQRFKVAFKKRNMTTLHAISVVRPEARD
uniref:Uncharacterized protein n=1 Tax=Gasterosteus aculeatus TaxID=69293 RepID=G3NW03_GASAC